MLILYLEDRQEKIAEMRSCVAPLGYRLRVFTTVASATKALAESDAFDMVVSGVHLELENALDLVRFIRQHSNLDHLPIILIDSHQTKFAKTVNDSLELACQTLGVTHYLAMSDFSPEQVRALIKHTLESIQRGSEPRPHLVQHPHKRWSQNIAAAMEEQRHDCK